MDGRGDGFGNHGDDENGGRGASTTPETWNQMVALAAARWPPIELPEAATMARQREVLLAGLKEYVAKVREAPEAQTHGWRLFFRVIDRRRPDIEKACDSFVAMVDAARSQRPTPLLGQVFVSWLKDCPETETIGQLFGVARALLFKLVENEERAVEAKARELARDLAKLQKAAAEFRRRWIETDHSGGPGGDGFLGSLDAKIDELEGALTGRPPRSRPAERLEGPLPPVLEMIREMSPHLTESDGILGRALVGLRSSFESFDPTRDGPTRREMRDVRFQALADAGLSHAEIAEFEGNGVREVAVTQALMRLRKKHPVLAQKAAARRARSAESSTAERRLRPRKP